eukprot:TRINITY_DN3628_c0_g1_i1.p1 TRINITY_DN3628_c0_g1~~TRINITY_DN3628_c0_g1_i1.p1  ORF type:complete len:748 (-),score=66.35 TRINITY_DN3628_c0_g1_i1:31-2274(-)
MGSTQPKLSRQYDAYDATNRSVKLTGCPDLEERVFPRRTEFTISQEGTRSFLVEDLLTAEECKQFVRVTEEKGFDTHDDVKAEFSKELRTNQRMIWIDVETSRKLWARMQSFFRGSDILGVQPVGFGVKGTWLPVGLNECLVFNKYSPGTEFNVHYDGLYKNAHREVSIFSVVIYLNDNYTGGELEFFEDPSSDVHRKDYTKENLKLAAKIRPSAGTALIFNGDVLHSSSKILTGYKYIIRSSVMFRRVEDLSTKDFKKDPNWKPMKDLFFDFETTYLKGPEEFTDTFLEAQRLQFTGGRSVKTIQLPLPTDIADYLFSYMDYDDILKMSQLNHIWRLLSRDGLIWQKRYVSEWGHTAMDSLSSLLKMDPSCCDWFGIFRDRWVIENTSTLNHFVVFIGLETVWMGAPLEQPVPHCEILKQYSPRKCVYSVRSRLEWEMAPWCWSITVSNLGSPLGIPIYQYENDDFLWTYRSCSKMTFAHYVTHIDVLSGDESARHYGSTFVLITMPCLWASHLMTKCGLGDRYCQKNQHADLFLDSGKILSTYKYQTETPYGRIYKSTLYMLWYNLSEQLSSAGLLCIESGIGALASKGETTGLVVSLNATMTPSDILLIHFGCYHKSKILGIDKVVQYSVNEPAESLVVVIRKMLRLDKRILGSGNVVFTSDFSGGFTDDKRVAIWDNLFCESSKILGSEFNVFFASAADVVCGVTTLVSRPSFYTASDLAVVRADLVPADLAIQKKKKKKTLP